jgi:nucleoside-diphosphate-sugar epimerase
MTIGIIGATGMLGHHIAIQAIHHQHKIISIQRPNSDLSRIKDLKCENRTADLNDRGSLIRAFAGLDAVVNAAAYYPTLPKPLAEEIKLARLQMQFFIDALEEANISRALYVGGAIAIPKNKEKQAADETGHYDQAPNNLAPYVQVKWLMDQMAQNAAKKGVPIIIGIPSMTFGEYDYGPTTGRLIVDLSNKSLPAYIEGERNVVYAGDAGRGLLYALVKGEIGERYLIGGYNTSTQKLVQHICQIARIPVLEKTLPLWAAKLISKFQEINYTVFGGTPPQLSSTAIAVLSGGQHLNIQKAQKELGYKPEINIDEMIGRAHNWFKNTGYIQ